MEREEYVEEGNARVSLTLNGRKYFYNNAQILNRDSSLLCVAAFAKFLKLPEKTGFKILELFGSTGIRGIRYAIELDDIIENVLINDLDRGVVDLALKNISLNKVAHKCMATCLDANFLSHALAPSPDLHRVLSCAPYRLAVGYDCKVPNEEIDDWTTKIKATLQVFTDVSNINYPLIYDIIDIDPYSTAAPYLDGALRCVRPGGMLCITSTDGPTLCGSNPAVSFYKYGGIVPKVPYCHEMALRILLHSIILTASKYKRYVVPLLSLSVDFYVRVFVQVFSSPRMCKDIVNKLGLGFHCGNCHAFKIVPIGSHYDGKQQASVLPKGLSDACEECGGHVKILGPMYIGEIHNEEFVKLCLNECSEPRPTVSIKMKVNIKGILTSISEEVEAKDSPFFYYLPTLCERHKLTNISPSSVKRCLKSLGYTASHFHREPQSVKTNAPSKVIMDIIREHAKRNPPKEVDAFLSKEIETPNIDLNLPKEQITPRIKIPRWLPNPEPNWGPKKAHKL